MSAGQKRELCVSVERRTDGSDANGKVAEGVRRAQGVQGSELTAR